MPCKLARRRSGSRLPLTETKPGTVDACRRQAVTRLLAAGVDTPLLDANVLLGEVLGVEPARIPPLRRATPDGAPGPEFQ